MARRRDKQRSRSGGRGSLAWDVAPLMLLAGAGVVLLREPGAHRARRLEVGRGRNARSLTEIPARGWKDILLRTWQEIRRDQVPFLSAGVAFYALLALFPGLTAFVSLYGLFADVADAQHHLQLLSFMLPPTTLQFVGDQMVRLAASNKGGLSFAFVIGLLVSVWSANGAVRGMMNGLNIAYEEKEQRGFVRATLVSLAFTVGYLAFVVAGAALLAARPAIETFVSPEAATVFGWASWAAVVVGVVVALALLYRYGPSRDPVRWNWISWGSAVVLVLWVLASWLFSLYVGNFGNYEKTYGSLGAAIGLLLWIYISAFLVLAGAELNAEIEHQTAVDTTIGTPAPMGFRRATMADTLGPARSR